MSSESRRGNGDVWYVFFIHIVKQEPTEDPDTPTTTPESTTRTTVQSTSTEANEVDYVTVTIVVTLSAVITVAIAVALILMIKIRRRSVRRNNKNGDVAGLCENPTYGNETSTTGVNTGGADEPQDQALSGHSNTTYRDQCDSHIYAVIPEGNDGRSRLENEHTCVRNKDTSRGTESFALSETSSHYIKMSDMSAAARISENSFGYVTMEEARTKSGAATRNEASSSGEYVSVDDINRRMTPTRLRKLRDGASPDAHILTQSGNPVRLDVDSKGYARLCE